MNYVAYYRVSTERQGKSGLGLESQKESVRNFVKSAGGTIIGEFTDIESGGNDEREYLREAISVAGQTGAPIVVKRLDRLSRGGLKITTELEELGIDYIDCEAPHDSPLIKDIKLSFAKDERAKISDRITSALGVIKENIRKNGYHVSSTGNKITSLGNPQYLGGEKAVARSVAVRKRKAATNPNNRRAIAMIEVLKDNGMSYRAIASYLNDHGFKTSRGNNFSDVQVKNLYMRSLHTEKQH